VGAILATVADRQCTDLRPAMRAMTTIRVEYGEEMPTEHQEEAFVHAQVSPVPSRSVPGAKPGASCVFFPVQFIRASD